MRLLFKSIFPWDLPLISCSRDTALSADSYSADASTPKALVGLSGSSEQLHSPEVQQVQVAITILNEVHLWVFYLAFWSTSLNSATLGLFHQKSSPQIPVGFLWKSHHIPFFPIFRGLNVLSVLSDLIMWPFGPLRYSWFEFNLLCLDCRVFFLDTWAYWWFLALAALKKQTFE